MRILRHRPTHGPASVALLPGETGTLGIEGIGTLENPVLAEAA
jgi:2-keto-4-pentenoate hydratase/2-oxohepta-3-ene-1,7-dioic acid hydratase in catechol pathway